MCLPVFSATSSWILPPGHPATSVPDGASEDRGSGGAAARHVGGAEDSAKARSEAIARGGWRPSLLGWRPSLLGSGDVRGAFSSTDCWTSLCFARTRRPGVGCPEDRGPQDRDTGGATEIMVVLRLSREGLKRATGRPQAEPPGAAETGKEDFGLILPSPYKWVVPTC